jgi:hypothetical protein
MNSQALFLGLFLCLFGAGAAEFPSCPNLGRESGCNRGDSCESLRLAAFPPEPGSARLLVQHWDCRIFGRVVSRGEPQQGVTVKLEGPKSVSTITNSKGEYSFQNLPPGTYKISFQGGTPFQRQDKVLSLRGFGSGPFATGERKQLDISVEMTRKPKHVPPSTPTPTPAPTASPRPSSTPTPVENRNVNVRTNVNSSNVDSNTSANTRTTSVDEQVSAMVTGKIVYQIPGIMKLGESTVIRVGIAKGITDDVKVTIANNRNTTIQDIKIKDVMAVDLISEEAEAFDVRRQQPRAGESPWQTIGGDTTSEWIFDVTPRLSGAHKLRLVASVLLDDPKKQNAPLSFKVYEKDTTVSTNYLYYAREFIKSYWQFLLTTLLLPAGAVAWRYFKKSPKPPEPPDWQNAA